MNFYQRLVFIDINPNTLGRGGGAGDGPPEYQFIRERRDNPKGPEKKQKTY